MKMIPLSYFFIFLIAAFFLGANPVNAQGGKEQWIFMGFTKYRDALYMERESIFRASPDIAWVWSLIAPSEKSKYRKEIKEELRKLKKSSKGLTYSEILNEIDCRGSRIRFLQIIYFDAQGSIIHSVASPDQE